MSKLRGTRRDISIRDKISCVFPAIKLVLNSAGLSSLCAPDE